MKESIAKRRDRVIVSYNHMLVLSRKVGETIMVGDNIEIMVTRIERDTVRIRISAPREIPIFRGELYREIKKGGEELPSSEVPPPAAEE